MTKTGLAVAGTQAVETDKCVGLRLLARVSGCLKKCVFALQSA